MGSRKETFDEVVSEHGPSIFRLCRAYLGSDLDVDDVYQETLINLWKALPGFRGESKISTWIYRITVNTAISYRRKKQRIQTTNNEVVLDQLAFDSSETVLKQEREKQFEQLMIAINQLKSDQRVLIGLYLEDLSYKEIAEVIGRDTNYVGVNIGRIKQKLTKMMHYG